MSFQQSAARRRQLVPTLSNESATGRGPPTQKQRLDADSEDGFDLDQDLASFLEDAMPAGIFGDGAQQEQHDSEATTGAASTIVALSDATVSSPQSPRLLQLLKGPSRPSSRQRQGSWR